MKLTFHGAAGEVTGSCHRVESGGLQFLVDCGLFQGGREAAGKNREAFGFRPRDLAFVILTHAHMDHSGLLPRLLHEGFRGPIYATPASTDLAKVMLADAAHIQERDYDRARRHGQRAPAPIYTVSEAEATVRRFRRVEYGASFEPAPGVHALLRDAGHILGSATVELGIEGRKLVFSGDLGQPGHPIVQDPKPVPEADWLVVESTYGDRAHRSMADTEEELAAALTDTLEAGGNAIVPAFTVGRTQDLLFLMAKLTEEGRLPRMDVYVDSPMASRATEIALAHQELFDPEAQAVMGRLMGRHGRPRVRFTEDLEDSKALNDIRGGAVIISASGMCEAGRIRHHLAWNLPRPQCAIIVTGFQAAGTLGRRLVDGARRVRLFGAEVPVRARIHTINGLSAHADQAGLLAWLDGFRRPPRQTFVVHGEAGSAQAFAEAVAARPGWAASVARRGQTVELA